MKAGFLFLFPLQRRVLFKSSFFYQSPLSPKEPEAGISKAASPAAGMGTAKSHYPHDPSDKGAPESRMRSKDACPVREPGAGSKISLKTVSDHALEFLSLSKWCGWILWCSVW